MDAETKQILTDAEEIRAMTSGTGWKIVKAKLDERVIDLQNINNLDVENIDTIGAQIVARKMASDLIYEWLKSDVFGAVEARDANIANPKELDESYVDRG